MTLFTMFIYVFLMGGNVDITKIEHQAFDAVEVCIEASKARGRTEAQEAEQEGKHVSGVASMCIAEEKITLAPQNTFNCEVEDYEDRLIKALAESPETKYGVFKQAENEAEFDSVVKDIEAAGVIFDVPESVDTVYLIPTKDDQGNDATHIFMYSAGCKVYWVLVSAHQLKFVPAEDIPVS